MIASEMCSERNVRQPRFLEPFWVLIYIQNQMSQPHKVHLDQLIKT